MKNISDKVLFCVVVLIEIAIVIFSLWLSDGIDIPKAFTAHAIPYWIFVLILIPINLTCVWNAIKLGRKLR